ncbi:hypothetical protein LguiA_035023 [Lonicera macranthoides]
MGYSASLVAIDLLQHLFKIHEKALTIVASTKSMVPHCYCGKERLMMLSNCLFRSSGCSMLFTNNQDLKNQAVLELKHLVRTHMGSSDEAYEGAPFNQLYHCLNALTWVTGQRYRARLKLGHPLGSGVHHLTNFTIALMPTLRQLLIGLVRAWDSPSMTSSQLGWRFIGSVTYTSAVGLWYVLGYMEANKRLKNGARIFMISLGAGFKCNTCVWEILRDLEEDGNVWKDCIESYPPETLVNGLIKRGFFLQKKYIENEGFKNEV